MVTSLRAASATVLSDPSLSRRPLYATRVNCRTPEGRSVKSTREIHEERVRELNYEAVRDGDYVLYWMQQAQRAEHNHALEYAVQRANELSQPLLVAFGLTDDYPSANARHYAFMLEGLRDAQQSLTRRGIRFVVQKGAPDEVALRLDRKSTRLNSSHANISYAVFCLKKKLHTY